MKTNWNIAAMNLMFILSRLNKRNIFLYDFSSVHFSNKLQLFSLSIIRNISWILKYKILLFIKTFFISFMLEALCRKVNFVFYFLNFYFLFFTFCLTRLVSLSEFWTFCLSFFLFFPSDSNSYFKFSKIIYFSVHFHLISLSLSLFWSSF